MERSHQAQLLEFGSTAVYRITVQGQLSESSTANIADARIEAIDQHTTRLLARVMDQAGLSGVLEAIYGLHLSILSVELVNIEAETKVN